MYQPQYDVIALDKLRYGCHLRYNDDPGNRTYSRAYYAWLKDWREKYATLMRLQDEYMRKSGDVKIRS